MVMSMRFARRTAAPLPTAMTLPWLMTKSATMIDGTIIPGIPDAASPRDTAMNLTSRPLAPPRPAPLRRRLAALAAGAWLAIALPAHAAQWQRISPGGKNAADKVEIDAASIDRGSEGKVRAWHRQTYATRQLQESWAFTYRSLKQLSEFDCGKRLQTIRQRIYLADDGSELRNERPAEAEARPLVPDTPPELVFSRVCRKPPAAKAGAESGSADPEADKAAAKKAPAPPLPQGPMAWTYGGKTGAEHWPKLSADYAACGGKWQSPIDIRSPIRVDLAPIRFTWKPVPLAIVDTGQTIEVETDDGGNIFVDGEIYALQGFRFRLPGEEVTNGQRAAMSVQFIHRSKSGQTAIVAVPLVEGKENRLIRTLWNALPLEPGKVKMPAGVRIDPGLLLPPKREYSTYVGSLTTPPCTEGVLWLVMKHPVSLSKAQIADFARVHKNNARPLQPAHGRVVKSSR